MATIDSYGTITANGATFGGPADVTFTGAAANMVWDRSVNALEFADNAKATFGNGPDLSIYHEPDDGNSWIRDVNDGNLLIDTNGTGIYLISDGSTTNGKMGVFLKDGAATLYHNNNAKIATNKGTACDTTTTSARAKRANA